LAQGWGEYEWRPTRAPLEEDMSKPLWTGAKRPRSTVLLRCEQGLGDAIQFVRYAALVKERVGRVVLECDPSLARLLATCPGVDEVVARGAPLPKFGMYAPLLSLPGVFETSVDTVPADVPYLAADAAEEAAWKEELSADKGFKVGVAWRGSPQNKADRFRSFALSELSAIAGVDGVSLYSLQFGPGREELGSLADRFSIVDLGDRLGDFATTAAIVRNLDLVIACDSAPAHLAGALGVNVWVALPFSPDWRWMLDRDDSPWYPTMRLFRQKSPGDWRGVFGRMAEALAARAR
jgi:hypothetical protein